MDVWIVLHVITILEANTSDGSCEIIDGICDVCEDGIIVDNDIDDDGV